MESLKQKVGSKPPKDKEPECYGSIGPFNLTQAAAESQTYKVPKDKSTVQYGLINTEQGTIIIGKQQSLNG